MYRQAHHILLILFLAVVFFWCFNQFKESDSFYHIRTGQLIWETRSVPTHDVYSYTAPGVRWVTHEWLAELIFFGAYRAGGFWGVATLVALIGALTYYLVFRTAVLVGANMFLAFLTPLALGTLTFELWIARPQVFAYLAFAALIFFLERYRRDGDRRFLLGAVFAIWFWANVNASVLLGIVTLGWYALAEAAVRIALRFFQELGSRARLIGFGVATASATAVALLNPNGFAVFSYPATIAEAARVLRVQEWLPITHFLDRPEVKFSLVLLAIVAFALITRFVRRREGRDLHATGLALGVSLMPFLSIRHVGFFPLAASAPLARILSVTLRGVFERVSQKRLATGTGIILALFLVGGALRLPRTTVDLFRVPVRAADFIEREKLQGPIFNPYHNGGYFIFRFFPRERVFFDGRSEVYAGRPTDELFRIAGNEAGGPRLWDEVYRVNTAILASYPYSLKESLAPFARELARRGWPLVYWDDDAVIFVRPIPAHEAAIERHAVRTVSPFRDPREIPPGELPAAAAELQALIARAPDSLLLEAYALEFVEAQSVGSK